MASIAFLSNGDPLLRIPLSSEKFLEVAEVFTSASGPEKTAAICYAVGWTQHSKGVQIIRSAAILQLLLGNIGRPGGGILALRGHATIQGSTDIPTLYDILPGYLPMPFFESDSQKLETYIKKHQSETGWWANFDEYIISLLKAWYGDAATQANEFGFNFMPRVSGDHSHFGYWLEMADGKMEGLFVMGQNPAVAGPNARLERRALAKLPCAPACLGSRAMARRCSTMAPSSSPLYFSATPRPSCAST